MKTLQLFTIMSFILSITAFEIPAQTVNRSFPVSLSELNTDEIKVIAWVYLEGPSCNAGGTQAFTAPMRTSLNDLHVLPGQTYRHFFCGIVYSPPGQPFGVAPWNYFGTEGDRYDSHGNPDPGTANYPATVVDWVLVSLRTIPDGESLCRKAALLHTDGHIEFVNGGFTCNNLVMDSAYYLAIEHRNHLIVMSPQPVPVIDGTLSFDFRPTQSYILDSFGFGGMGQKEILPGVFAMFAGNGDQVLTGSSDTDINFDDGSYWEGQNGTPGHYSFSDFNLNGDCNFNDRSTWEYNNGKFTTVPRN